MTQVEIFEFSPFSENTYVVYDETKECVIVDPGCFFPQEKAALRRFIEENGLKPVRLLLTHAHLDHIFGNKYVFDTWGLLPECHEGEVKMLQDGPKIAQMYGLPAMDKSPEPGYLIKEGETLTFGVSKFEVIFTPGHSPASISFYCPADDFVLSGDVLFYESIGRTDLPGGDLAVLTQSIRNKLYTLPAHTLVLSGHGPGTTIRHEKQNNPFVSVS